MITDVAAAGEAARAAAVTSRVNIEVNLRGITDAAIQTELVATAAAADEITARADRIVAVVREEVMWLSGRELAAEIRTRTAAQAADR